MIPSITRMDDYLEESNGTSTPWRSTSLLGDPLPAHTVAWVNSSSLVLPVEECERLHILNASFQYIVQEFIYNGTNVVCLEHAPVLTKASLIRAVILGAMGILSFAGNLATIISIRRGRRGRKLARPGWTAIYSLILQLSMADLLVTVFCIGGEAAWSYTVAWHAGNVMCKLFKFVQVFSLYLSTFVLVLIGVDRWLAVRHPMKSMGTVKRSARLVAAAWTLSVVFSIPQMVIFHEAKGPFYEDFYQCVTHGFYTEKWQEQLYTTLTLIFMFILPLFILVCTYVSTVITIAKSEKIFKTEIKSGVNYLSPDCNRRRLIHKAKMKSLRISVVIVAAFVIWWTPYYTMMIIFTFLNPNKHVSDELQSGIFFFGMSNSLVNPVIYGAFHLWPARKKRLRSSQREGSSGGILRSTLTMASFIRKVDPDSHAASFKRSSYKHVNGNNNSHNQITSL